MQIKHSQLEHSDHKEPCCVGMQANQNTANWKRMTATSPAASLTVCREMKTRLKLTAASCAESV
jgi:hypothetical protein